MFSERFVYGEKLNCGTEWNGLKPKVVSKVVSELREKNRGLFLIFLCVLVQKR